MVSKKELRKIVKSYRLSEIDMHIHILWDPCADDEMTVEKILQMASERNLRLIGITPHCHQIVKDEKKVYIPSTDISNFSRLREKVDEVQKKYPDILILLGTEVDILNESGSLSLSKESKMVINDLTDFIMPATNWHPLIPFRYLLGSTIEEADRFYQTEKAEVWAEFGQEKIIKSLFQGMINAISNHSSHTMILGHPLAFLSSIRGYDRFDINKNIELSLKCIENLTDTLAEYNTLCEINAHFGEEMDDGLLEMKKKFVESSKKKKVQFVVGSDAHNLSKIGETEWAIRLINKIG